MLSLPGDPHENSSYILESNNLSIADSVAGILVVTDWAEEVRKKWSRECLVWGTQWTVV